MPAPSTNGPPEISVVLATYNRRHSLPRAIASVQAQDGVRFELIIVDDASSDDTPAYLATLPDPRIRVITCDRNRGPSAARNAARSRRNADHRPIRRSAMSTLVAR